MVLAPPAPHPWQSLACFLLRLICLRGFFTFVTQMMCGLLCLVSLNELVCRIRPCCSCIREFVSFLQLSNTPLLAASFYVSILLLGDTWVVSTLGLL